MVRICFVCLGNICRSPTAEGVMRHLVQQAGLSEQIMLDSAGTSAYHTGEPPDVRATTTARQRGIVLSGAARQLVAADLHHFDLLLAMDQTNLEAMRRLATTADARQRIALLRAFDPDSPPGAEVPDPYYGGSRGFEQVLDICIAACQGLLAHVRRQL